MKKIALALIVCICTTLTVHAQTNEVEILKSKYKHGKKEIVSAFMNLPEADAKKFWPIYDEYEHERGKISQKRIDMLSDYANNYDKMNDESADKLITGVFDFQSDMMSLRKDYYKKMKKALGAHKAASFVQIEEFLESVIRIAIQINIPYIGDSIK